MIAGILLLLLVGIGVGLWFLLQPAEAAVSTEAPVVETPIKSMLFGLWDAPKEHFWSDNLRVGPPQVTRDEYIPHGPRVAEQAGRTRPYLGSRKEASVWTELLRRLANISGVANLLDKSTNGGGSLDRRLLATLCGAPKEVLQSYDGGDQPTESTNILSGGDAYTTGPTLDTMQKIGNFCH